MKRHYNHSHSENTCLETHEKVLWYVFHHVFFVGMCTSPPFKAHGKIKFEKHLPHSTPFKPIKVILRPLTLPGFQTIFHKMTK